MSDLAAGVEKFFSIDANTLNHYLLIVVKILFILVISKIALVVINRVINKSFKLYPKFKKDERKSNTLSGILKSVIKYTVYIVAGISILNVLEIPTQPLIATAGLGGIAIGFGAQSLIRDVVTGFFILFEDQFSVGDFVTIGTMTGTVEDMGLRITKIRAFNGDLHIIPNGEIKMVTNQTRGNTLAIVDVSITYETDAEKAMEIIAQTAKAYMEDNKDKVVETPEVLGITRLDQFEVVIRTIAQCEPLTHWGVERGMRKAILDAFKQENIEIPYSRMVMLGAQSNKSS